MSVAEIEAVEVQLDAPSGSGVTRSTASAIPAPSPVSPSSSSSFSARSSRPGSRLTIQSSRTCCRSRTAAVPAPRPSTGSASTCSGGSLLADRVRRPRVTPDRDCLRRDRVSIGLVLGATAGYVGGWVDSAIMRVMDVMLAIPGLLAIGIVAALGPGLKEVMIAVGLANVPIFARLLRGSILAQREADFVTAAKAVGVRRPVILFSHILPNAISPVIVTATLAMATAIIDVADSDSSASASRIPTRTRSGGACSPR